MIQSIVTHYSQILYLEIHLLANNVYLYPQINIWGASWLLAEMCRIVKNSIYPTHRFSARSNKVTLLSCSSHNVNKYLFHSVFRTTFCLFLCFLFVILLLKMTPKQHAKVLSGFSKFKKAVICLVEEIRVLDKLHSGISDSAVTMNLTVMNQQHILNKRSLNRSTD